MQMPLLPSDSFLYINLMNSDSECSFGSIIVDDNKPLYSFGMHFCPTCKNLMRPFLASQHLLDFICDKCGKKQTVDYSKRTGDDSLLYSKELQAGARKFVPDLAYIFDPTMPSVEVECPECGYNRAVYILAPDDGETKLVAVMLCASQTGTVAKCGHIWTLDDDTELTRTKVKSEEERMFESL